MGSVDIERQAPNVERMRILGARVEPVTSGDATFAPLSIRRFVTRSPDPRPPITSSVRRWAHTPIRGWFESSNR